MINYKTILVLATLATLTLQMPKNCAVHNKLTPAQCSTCKTGFARASATLNADKIKYPSGTTIYHCSPCAQKGCATCGTKIDKCTTALPGWVLDDNKIPKKCEDPKATTCDKADLKKSKGCESGWGLKSDKCVKCADNCITCSEAGKCTTCNNGFAKDGDKCSPCAKNCACNEKGKCSQCIGAFAFKTDKCVDACAANCATCSDTGEEKCTSCKKSFYLSKVGEGKCLPNIKNCISQSAEKVCLLCDSVGFFFKGGTPESCPACEVKNCMHCKNGKCYDCMEGYKLSEDYKTCKNSSFLMWIIITVVVVVLILGVVVFLVMKKKGDVVGEQDYEDASMAKGSDEEDI